MAANENAAEATITLKGSAEIVAEFFNYGINSILYQRGVYPPESFVQEKKYGLTILVTDNKELKEFLHNVLKQLKVWLETKELNRVSIVMSSPITMEVFERWDFRIECDSHTAPDGKPKQKELKQIQKEIGDIIRQITASVTFLPLLEMPCSFDVQAYTRKDVQVPEEWGDTAPGIIENSQEVRLRSFSTTIHKVDAFVQYRGVD